MGQKYAAYDSQGAIVAFYDSEDSPAPEGAQTIAISDDEWQACLSSPLYKVVAGALVAPSAALLAAQAAALKAAEMSVTRDSLMAQAAQRIAPLQDAVDLAVATDAEIASLKAWKEYRVALNRLDLTADSVSWPAIPA